METTSKLTATIDLTLLKAASQCASNDGSRYSLASVCLEISAKQVIYVATDGHILFAVRAETELNTLIGTFIVPLETIKAIKPVRSNNYATLEGLTDKDNSLWLSFNLTNRQSYGFRPVDGEYADWRAVCPKDVPTDRLEVEGKLDGKPDGTVNRFSYDPNLLLKLYKAGKLLGCDYPDLSANGMSPGFVIYPGYEAFGLIMPSSRKREPQALPEWIWSKPADTESKAA